MGQENHNFTVETEGHCFLCSNKILSPVHPVNKSSIRHYNSLHESSSSSNTHSLHCLSQYLRMDMRKIFFDNDDIPPQLLEKVASSKLKVELCNDCVFINDSISKRWRQLEKVNMELSSLLNLTLRKLDKVGLYERMEESKLTVSHSRGLGSLSLEKLLIVRALRKEARIKCSANLQNNRPKVRIPNLTREQVNRSKLKIKNMQKLKREFQPSKIEAEFVSNFVSNDYDEDLKTAYEELPRTEGSDLSTAIEDCAPPDITSDGHSIESVDNMTGKNFEMARKRISNQGVTANIAAPIKVAGMIGKPNWRGQFINNLETGKFKCKHCLKEFAHKGGFLTHYESAHLQMKYKCQVCEKEFPYMASYNNHYLDVHIGVRFKCTFCDKTFKQKVGLDKHMDSAHLGRRFECQFCSRTFSQPGQRNIHIKRKCSVARAAKQGKDTMKIDSS